MNIRITVFTALVAISSPKLFAQEDLGMRITGDDDASFGLTISNWVNGNQAGTLAPGLLSEQILPLDEWELRRQIELERAASAPGAAINKRH